MSTQTKMCELANRFIDGELLAAEDEVYRNHLADCAACQEETEAALVLEFLVEQGVDHVSAEKRLTATNVPTPWWKKRIVWVAVPGLVAAAAAVFLWVNRNQSTTLESDALAVRFESALRPTRSIEARLSYSGADSYREYDVPRADTGNIEKISASLLAGFESAKTSEASSALAAAYTLMGATELAERILAEREAQNATDATGASNAETATTLSDRAVLALGENQPSKALLQTAAAIEADETLAAAKWNHALALSKLNLPLAAANAFDAVAKLGEPGWSGEAETRAKTLRANYDERKARWQKGFDALEELAKGGAVPSEEIVRDYPEIARLGFYDAVRATADDGRFDELTIFAAVLDRMLPPIDGYTFGQFIRTVRAKSSSKRKKLAARYAALRSAFGNARDSSLVSDAIEAKQDDIALGALYWEPTLDATTRALYLELGMRSKDPWLDLLAKERVARDHVLGNQPLEAIKEAQAALTECQASPFDFRCIRIEYWLATAFLRSHALDSARRHAESGLRLARAQNDWVMKLRFLATFTEIETSQDDVLGSRLALSQAYADELQSRSPGCTSKVYYTQLLANAFINRQRNHRAAQLLSRLDRECSGVPTTLERLHLDAHLVGEATDRADAVLTKLAKLTGPTTPTNTTSDRAVAAHIAGRALLWADNGRGESKLRRAIELSDSERTSVKSREIRGWSFALLAESAAKRGEFKQVVRLLGEELGIEVEGCALGISLESVISMAAVDQKGKAIGSQIPVAQLLDGKVEKVVPTRLIEHLRACKVVDVFARAPFLGRPILPAKMQWRFRLPKRPLRTPLEPARHVIISSPAVPEELGLAPLVASPTRQADVHLRASEATPSKVMSSLKQATFAELHAHGRLSSDGHGGASIVLAPDRDGKFVLTADDLRNSSFERSPVMVLSACEAAIMPSYQQLDLGLAGALLAAGASAVVASSEPIPDRPAFIFFDSLRQGVEKGLSLTSALSAAKDSHPGLSGWTQKLVVFE